MRAELIETTASFTILAVSYLARRTENGCTNLGRGILRYAMRALDRQVIRCFASRIHA
jgi:hypothetical protein